MIAKNLMGDQEGIEIGVGCTLKREYWVYSGGFGFYCSRREKSISRILIFILSTYSVRKVPSGGTIVPLLTTKLESYWRPVFFLLIFPSPPLVCKREHGKFPLALRGYLMNQEYMGKMRNQMLSQLCVTHNWRRGDLRRCVYLFSLISLKPFQLFGNSLVR